MISLAVVFLFSPMLVLNLWKGYAEAAKVSFCEQYRGNSASDSFCQNKACKGYCEVTSLPYHCMDSNYVQTGYCSFHGDVPPEYCTSKITGIRPEHVNWCQTVGCTYATYQCLLSNRKSCYDDIVYWVKLKHGKYCQAIGEDGSSPVDPDPIVTPTTTTTRTTTQFPTTTTTTTRTYTTTTTTTRKRTTTTAPPGNGGCYAPKGWSGQPCAECPNSRASDVHCPSFTWTSCYPTLQECKKHVGGGAACEKECPENTRSMRRPSFKGPNCYSKQYGSRFGPDWAPSKRTAFEKYIPDASKLYRLIQVTREEVPMMSTDWKLSGCDAATAMYENIVCALELLEEKNILFEAPPRGGSPASILSFGNEADDQINRVELAAFFSHKFKETGRFVAWEERATGYTEPNAQYPPYPGASYHGRGPIQLSWNYNYGAFSEWFFKDKNILLQHPDYVDPEGPMGFIAAFWFWFSPRGFYSGAPVSGNIRTRDAIVHWKDNKMNSIYNDNVNYDAVAGLGLSTNVINGGIECTGSGDSGLWRVAYFMSVASRLGVNLPNVNDFAACQNDKYCRGMTSGCRSTNKPIICTPDVIDCDTEPDVSWATYSCKFA